MKANAEFQFTHPGRGATKPARANRRRSRVSIHAPREGCDRRSCLQTTCQRCFNSRTPGGVRLVPDSDYSGVGMFQFTHPGRGATQLTIKEAINLIVSIHAPREGCDRLVMLPLMPICSFNSRTPGGVRLLLRICRFTHVTFQFTHPGRGATRFNPFRLLAYQVSIHAPREGCDPVA